jgi:hypothetical protein
MHGTTIKKYKKCVNKLINALQLPDIIGSGKPALLKEILLWIFLQQLLSDLCQRVRLIAGVTS